MDELRDFLADTYVLRPEDVMIPGKTYTTYTRRGAFVRKPSTPRKLPKRDAEKDEVDDEDVQPNPTKLKPKPAKAAIVAAKRAAEKPIEIGVQKGQYDSASVRERVRQWQAQGGGVVSPEIVVEFEDSDEEKIFKPGKSHTQPETPVKERWGAREEKNNASRPSKSPAHAKQDSGGCDQPNSPATPKKRIVSDGHWKSKRTPPTAKLAEDGIRVRPIGDDMVTKSAARTYQDDGIRVRASPEVSRRNSMDSVEEATEIDNTTKDSYTETSDVSETMSEHSMNATEETGDEPESAPVKRTVNRKDTKRSARGIFSAVLTESKKMFAKTETVYIAPPENPRIDNWLGAIPDLPDDPFVNDEKPEEESEVANLPSRRKRRSKSAIITSPDPNGIWEAVSSIDTVPDSAEDLWKRQRRRTASKNDPKDNQSPKLDSDQTRDSNTDQDTDELTPKSLRRRGARRNTFQTADTPPKDRPANNARGIAALQALFSKSTDEEIKTLAQNVPLERSDISTSSPHSSPLRARRAFPSVGAHKLSTIASMDTLNTTNESSVLSEISTDSDFTARPKSRATKTAIDSHINHGTGPRRKKTRLTRHADLISILSEPRTHGKSIRSARSIRTHRGRLDSVTIPILMKEITDDEVKYMRELRTLVDGVIPVLLSSMLSKSESANIVNLFGPQGKSSSVSDMIFAMGVALEGLKKWHHRLEPSTSGPVSVTVFLTWAQGVHRTYKDYLKAWRLGFKDVVVNLAPAANEESKDEMFHDGLPRNSSGDVTNADGERVDVAFLLKRPLVRLKYLAKTLKGINHVQPSTLAEKLAADYQGLVEDARHRVNEEKARLEDEAAAHIDTTKARSLVDLKPHTNVSIVENRRVRARDFFDLSLVHTNGQRVDSRVELFIRDDPPGIGTGADFLICQLDAKSKWLLFPPISTNNISARNGDLQGEIVIMIRGTSPNGQEWRELFSLICDDEQTGFEWVQMLGLVPVPPAMRGSKFVPRKLDGDISSSGMVSGSVTDSLASDSTHTTRTRTLSRQEMQAPLGESVSTRINHNRASSRHESLQPIITPNKMERQTSKVIPPQDSISAAKETASTSRHERSFSADTARNPRSLNDAMRMAGSSPSSPERYRATGKRPESICVQDGLETFVSDSFENNRDQGMRTQSLPFKQPTTETSKDPLLPRLSRPGLHTRNSSTPNTELPTVGKLRKNQTESNTAVAAESDSRQRPNKLTKQRPVELEEDVPPPPPPHRVPTPQRLSRATTPEFEPPTLRNKPLSSSPLKHQYEPSSTSDDGSDTSSASDENMSDSASSSSDDEDCFEMEDVLGPLPQQPFQRTTPPASQPSLPSKTLGPSSSASQAPYKTVPAQPNKALRIAATISYWSDTNTWSQLHPDVCSIVVTPGLVEIYKMSPAHSYRQHHDSLETGKIQPEMPSPAAQPLLVLHLTPMVLLQQGTALDVTVRSPPQGGTMKGTFTGVNFLFRSRSPEEAEALYGMLHHARMNNPTYIALQQARATADKPTFDPTLGAAKGRTTSWFSFGRQKSYRATSEPTPRAKSDPSVGTRTTSFSAKLFGNGRFNIARSSITSRKSPDGSIYTTSDNSLNSGTSTPLPENLPDNGSAPLGLSNTKIRLYSREGTRWLDLGSATLTIMRPTNVNHPHEPNVDLESPPEVGFAQGVGSHGVITPTLKRSSSDKRIVVISAKKDQTLLDVTLGESCFERTARTGIALSLWELFEGNTVADRGGVTNGRYRYFMMQFQNEAACAFTFSIVGRHRF